MSEFLGTILSRSKLRKARTQIARELERFREPMLHDHVRVYELRDGQVLWTQEEPEIYGYYGSVWPSEDALWRYISEPLIMDWTPRTIASTLGLDEAALRPDSVEAMRGALAAALKIAVESLDYSRASFRQLNQATRKEPANVWNEPDRLRPLIAYLGEAVRRTVGGEWGFEQDQKGLLIYIETPLRQKIDFVNDPYAMIDEGEYPNWVTHFDEMTEGGKNPT